MNQQSLKTGLEDLLRAEGVRACALVDSESGLVWQAVGRTGAGEDATLWEAAIDYWRMHGRLRQHFVDTLGELGAAVMYHRLGVLALLPCGGQSMVLVCVAEHRGVDWSDWQRRVRALASELGL